MDNSDSRSFCSPANLTGIRHTQDAETVLLFPAMVVLMSCFWFDTVVYRKRFFLGVAPPSA